MSRQTRLTPTNPLERRAYVRTSSQTSFVTPRLLLALKKVALEPDDASPPESVLPASVKPGER